MSANADMVQINNNVLLPRSGHKVVADEKYLYVIGGYVEKETSALTVVKTFEVCGEIWRFHLIYRTWEICQFDQNLFSLGASHAVTKIGDCIFITGGTGMPFGVDILNQMIVVNIRQMTQRKLSFNPRDNNSRNLPIATYGLTMNHARICSRPYLYIIGGTTGTTYHAEVYRVDLATLESELVSDAEASNGPRPRYKHESFVYNDQIYVIGGATVTDFCHSLDDVHVIDLHSHKWKRHRTSTRIDVELRCPSMCQNNRFIYLTGGYGPDNIINSTIYQLDLRTLCWTSIGRWSSPAYFHDSVFLPQTGVVLAFGGVNAVFPAQKRSNELYELQPQSGRMARTLMELAWSAMLDGVLAAIGMRDIKKACTITETLIQLGVPDSIIVRTSAGNYSRVLFAA